jgi:hypothetical protein
MSTFPELVLYRMPALRLWVHLRLFSWPCMHDEWCPGLLDGSCGGPLAVSVCCSVSGSVRLSQFISLHCVICWLPFFICTHLHLVEYMLAVRTSVAATYFGW